MGFQSCARSGGDAAAGTESTEEPTEPETEIEAEITVNGVQIHGLTKSEAMKKVLADMGWGMKVSFEDHTEDLPNLMEANVDAVIDEALAKKESGDYTVEAEGLDDAVQAEVKALAANGMWSRRTDPSLPMIKHLTNLHLPVPRLERRSIRKNLHLISSPL